ncbi:MAG: choice-of-anchor tandem repeat GloVer-containing protein [Candidatus Cybelea sp.]
MTRLLSISPICLLAAVLVAFTGCAETPQGLRMTPESATTSPSRASVMETVIHRFGAHRDGAVPLAGLVNVRGTLYGTTITSSGTECYVGCGAIFRVTTDGTEAMIHRFSGTDGETPAASLIDVDGTLYGTTENGGYGCSDGAFRGCGTVFSVTTSGKLRVLYRFMDPPDGNFPRASLINVKGTLYGTTSSGGEQNYGTVFRITRSGRERVLYSFGGYLGRDGADPEAGLINVGGVLYGTTASGAQGGTVFSVTLSGKEKVVYRFGSHIDDGKGPHGLVNLNGTLYGTTFSGGKYNNGTVFSVTTSGKEKVLHSFTGVADGLYPFAGLVNVNGTLYGTTYAGGSSSYGEGIGGGTVFSIQASGTHRVLYAFGGPPDASFPEASLVDVSGKLFGTTAGGGGVMNCPGYNIGGYGCGTVFSLTLKGR